MRVYYGNWETYNAIMLAELIPEEFQEEVKAELETALNSAYDEGESAGFERGEEEAFAFGAGDDWATAEILDGSFDEQVVKRAKNLGYGKTPIGPDLQQEKHVSAGHQENGPWGWEYCSRC